MPSPEGVAPSSRGFTLIEVLIAVVILATGVVVVLQGMHTALAALDGAVDKSRSAALLRSKIVEAQAAALDGMDPSSLRSGGNFPEPYEAYRWRLNTGQGGLLGGAKTLSDAGELHEVGITVWRDGAERSYEASTLVYVPPAPDDAALDGGGL